MHADSVQQVRCYGTARTFNDKNVHIFFFLNGKIPFKMQFLSSKQFLRQKPFKMLFWMTKYRSKCMRNGHSYSMRKPRIAPAHKEQGIWILIFPDTEKTGNLPKTIKNMFQRR